MSTRLKHSRFVRASAARAKHHIAMQLLSSDVTRIGDITLRPHQQDAVTRLEHTLSQHHGALLADEVGLGKTYVALAIARAYDTTHILAPANLLPMWRAAIARTDTKNVVIHSLHRASQNALALPVVPASQHALVIVDEAHYLRTPNTNRYRRVAQFVVGHDVLLLSATPVHNRPHDLRALLSLFLGSRANLLSSSALEQLVVRRQYDAHAGIPRIVKLRDVSVECDKNTLHRILALPDPLPAQGGATAGALIRLGLLRAWCSSDAALSHAVRVRRLRGEALAHALRQGKYPSAQELHAWIVADDSVQLAFAELVVHTSPDTAPLLVRLTQHLDALAELQVHHAHQSRDHVRANALRDLLRDEPARPIVAFSQFTRTVTALYRALADIAGVACIAGRSARIASGTVSRADVIHRFAPQANGKPPPHPRERIRLLLTTDLLAEGVNLQDAGIVVHLDLPWTDALRRQREGRCARIGAAFDPVYVVTLLPPPGVDRLIGITETLQRKAGIANALIGSDSNTAPQSPADVASHVRKIISTWSITHMNSQRADDKTLLAFASGPVTGWLALLETECGTRMVGHHSGRTSEYSLHLQPLVESLDDFHGPDPTSAQRRFYIDTALRDLQRWIDAQECEVTIGPAEGEISALQKQALAKLAHLLDSISPVRRAQVAVSARIAENVIRAAKPLGAEQGLEQWLKSWRDNMNITEWLYGWKHVPSLKQTGLAFGRFSPVALDTDWKLDALLIIQSHPNAALALTT